MSDIDIKFEKNYKIAVISMRINGSYPSIARNKLWLIHFSFVFSINVIIFCLLCNSILLHDVIDGNYAEACKNTAMVIVCMNTTIKYLVLLYHQQSIEDLIHIVDNDYELAKQFLPDEQYIVKRYAKEGKYVCLFWFLCASSGGAMFPLKGFILTARSFWAGENDLKPMFDFTFPEVIEKHKDNVFTFWGIFALCFMFAFFAAIIYIGFDPLIPIFTLHTCGQLDLLSGRITTAFSKNTTVEEIQENLKQIIIKLQDLYKLVNRVQTNFEVLYEFNMKTTTIVLPLIAFHVVEDIRCGVISYEFFILFIGANLHFLMPCYYSDLLMEKEIRGPFLFCFILKSTSFRQALYSCGWEKQSDKRIRQTVLFMLTRATRPLCISTVFYNISLDTFATMIRQSYGIFNLMNAAWGQ